MRNRLAKVQAAFGPLCDSTESFGAQDLSSTLSPNWVNSNRKRWAKRALKISLLSAGLYGFLLSSAFAQSAPAHEPKDEAKELAGRHGGQFFIRDANDNYRLQLGGRLNLDAWSYAGPGVSDTDLTTALTLKRARLEMRGEFFQRWQFVMQAEIGPSAIDNRKGTNESSAAPVGTNPTASTAQYAAVQPAAYRAHMEHAYVNYRVASELNIRVGQFYVPFMMENQTSTNLTTFLDKSFAVRNVGAWAGTDLGLSVGGELPKGVLGYQVGIFGGDGLNRPNVDNKGDWYGRLVARPLAAGNSALKDLQFGTSFHYGNRDKDRVGYDVPSMTTMGGYAFWNPTYRDGVQDPNTKVGRLVHILPAGNQYGVAGELRIPVSRFDIQAEVVYVSYHTREAVDGYQLKNTERMGTLKGLGYYAQLGYWLWGKPYATGYPGDDKAPHIDFAKPDPGPSQSVEASVRWEQMNLTYDSASRAGEPGEKNVDGDIRVSALSAIVNYWVAKNVRLSGTYSYYYFPDSAPSSASAAGGPSWSSTQRAQAPGNTLGKGINNDARDSAHSLHEIGARLALAF